MFFKVSPDSIRNSIKTDWGTPDNLLFVLPRQPYYAYSLGGFVQQKIWTVGCKGEPHSCLIIPSVVVQNIADICIYRVKFIRRFLFVLQLRFHTSRKSNLFEVENETLIPLIICLVHLPSIQLIGFWEFSFPIEAAFEFVIPKIHIYVKTWKYSLSYRKALVCLYWKTLWTL